MDKKYFILFDTNKYFFIDNFKMNESKCIIVVINNKIKLCSDKLMIIEMLFRLFKKNMCNITLITIFPKIAVNTISSISDLINIASNFIVCYELSNIDNIEINNKIFQIVIELKYANNISDITLICYDSLHLLKISNEIKKNVKCVSNNNNAKFSLLLNDDFDCFEGNDKCIITKTQFDIDYNQTQNKDVKQVLNIEFLIYKLFEICIYTKNRNNIKNIVNLIFDIFNTFELFFTKVNCEKYLFLINILKEWIFCLKLMYKNNNSKFLIQNSSCFSHISVKNTKKIIKSLEIFNMKNIEDEINNNYNNLINQIANLKLENQFYFSKFSMGGWKEEFEEKSCLCLILAISVADYNKSGKTLNDVMFTNLTKNFVSALDYINVLNSYPNFSGDPINLGLDNLALPLFINKYHWTIARSYRMIMLSIAFTGNVNVYNSKFDNIYYLVMNQYFKLFIETENRDDKIIYFKIWTGVFRTSIELSKEKHYHKGILTYCNNLMKINIKNINLELLFGQLVSVGQVIKLNGDLNNFEKFIKSLVKSIDPTDSKKIKNFNILYLQLELISKLKNKLRGFKNLIKHIDQNNGSFSKFCETYVVNNFSSKKIDNIKDEFK